MATRENELGWGHLVEAGRLEIEPRISQIKLHRLFLQQGGNEELDAFTEHLHDRSGGFSVHNYNVASKLVNDLLEHCGKERQVPEIGSSFPNEGFSRMMFAHSPVDLHFRDRSRVEAGSVTGRVTSPLALAG